MPVTGSTELSSDGLGRAMTVIAVAGGSGSGKTTLARALAEALAARGRALILEQDCYYRDQSDRFDQDGGQVNFDHPDSIDWPLLVSHIQSLKAGQPVNRPNYDFSTHTRRRETLRVDPPNYLILDGILILVPEELRCEFSCKIFVDTSENVRFQRRLERDVRERGRTPEGVKAQFYNQVKPMHDLFVAPSCQHADILISESGAGPADIAMNVRRIVETIISGSDRPRSNR